MSKRSRDSDPESTELAAKITVRKYREMVRLRNRTQISELVQRRFEERYLNPVLGSRAPHGFAILAVCCLMVEALESFRQGWTSTKGKGRSEAAFCGFFQAHDEFRDLRPVAYEFYRAVRCGILHQAETTHGWRVHRERGRLIIQDGAIHWISASEFAQGLKGVLETYGKTLKTADWQSPIWVNTRRKLQSICKNSGASDVAGLA